MNSFPKNQSTENPIITNGGFHPLTSNTTYTPNQFFDVCIPNYSRGVVRLVGFMIRKTLGWCDREGNPQESQIVVSYNELIHNAGISREMIREAIDDAIAGNFIRCVRAGQESRAGESSITALYELCWDEAGEYIKDLAKFKGFFAGEGNRTDIPNEFFDHVMPNETLSVVKVVASILRFSIGFQAQKGVRRQVANLSYDQIQRYGNIKNRTIVSEALKKAMINNYVVRVSEGYFDPDCGKLSHPASYSIRWSDSFNLLPREEFTKFKEEKTQKGAPVRKTYRETSQKNVPANQSEKRTGWGQKNVPTDQSEKRTYNKIKPLNKTFKEEKKEILNKDFKKTTHLYLPSSFYKEIFSHFKKDLILTKKYLEDLGYTEHQIKESHYQLTGKDSYQ